MGLLTRQLHQHLRDSFANVRKDTTILYDWINYLNACVRQQHNIITQQHNTIIALHNHLRSVPTSQQVKQLVQSPFQQLQQMQQRLKTLNLKVNVVAALHDTTHAKVSELQQQLSGKKTTALKEKLVKTVSRNSKSYMKNIFLNTIQKYQKISGQQLKELLVDEQKLCSKSSFYRLLQELEDEEKCELTSDGRQKLYSAKTIQI